ncbi:hypothetical protein SAMN06265219_103153 [Gracilimonas mengyeensis]|uniref:Glycoamylase-like domain-containing protein n=1 Tax=Gracilimonas mengyeensis TaxID=1302730 RepID=A0A521BWD0_9BACT|nr:hypothetical protein SAMN06265219_103153 [Gracilimonas mengyeensis]
MLTLLILAGCKDNSPGQQPGTFQLLKVQADGKTLSASQANNEISIMAVFRVEFSAPVDTAAVPNNVLIAEQESGAPVELEFSFEDEQRTITATPVHSLKRKTAYRLDITENIQSAEGGEFPGVSYSFETKQGEVMLTSATANGEELSERQVLREVAYDNIELSFTFSEPLNPQDFQSYISVSPTVPNQIQLSEDSLRVTITNNEAADYYRHYTVSISGNLTSAAGAAFEGYQATFQTGLNPEYKFPEISDEQLLTNIQEATFGYFWDFAHPVSGLSRERNTSGDIVTTGGSGFGLMAILVGIHRGFITQQQGVERLDKITDFLQKADRFHGAWAHWMNGATGDAVAFSTYDDGGDLVETAFMAQGLITVREYLKQEAPNETELINRIDGLLDTIEWDWYTRGGQNVLYWHWSPEHEWRMNMPIKGYNEALIVYVLAAASETHGIEPEVYHEGWASSGAIENGQEFYGINLPVGYDYGGPLFFAHYSFLGLDPRNLSDTYADYWQQNRNHTLINHEHSIRNPNSYVGYSADSWGLTASDNPFGYQAHEPTRDNGTITPTAAVSSLPYTPEESMDAIRHFYYVLGDKLWGEYGFHDAFNPTETWWANSYLAIDQGPIIIMIENHRSGLLWDLFMKAPEIEDALDELGFSSD